MNGNACGGMCAVWLYGIFFSLEMLRYRCPNGEEKSDAPTYVSIVNPRCCNYYFRMFHGDCCMKHGVQVAAEFSYPRVKQLN